MLLVHLRHLQSGPQLSCSNHLQPEPTTKNGNLSTTIAVRAPLLSGQVPRWPDILSLQSQGPAEPMAWPVWVHGLDDNKRCDALLTSCAQTESALHRSCCDSARARSFYHSTSSTPSFRFFDPLRQPSDALLGNTLSGLPRYGPIVSLSLIQVLFVPFHLFLISDYLHGPRPPP